MEFKDLSEIAMSVRKSYETFEEKRYGKSWSREQLAQGFVGDVGDLMKLVMAKEGIRQIEDVDEKFSHELSDCLWSIMVLAQKYDIDLEQEFVANMKKLKEDMERKE
jgi:NTP pyrophosphatase (non-canonical NTP hydrolase)